MRTAAHPSTHHRPTARLTASAAVLALAAGLAGAVPAAAQPSRADDNWVDGDWVQETIISCVTGQPAPGYTGRVSFQGVGDRLPMVGETFWIRMEVGLPGLPCNQTPMVLPEILIPEGLEYADDAQHPVAWAIHDVDGPGTGWSTDDLVYDLGVNGGILIGLESDDYPQGGPIEVRQGESLEIRVPVRAAKAMKGAGTRQPQCQDRRSGTAPCPVEESGDHVQVAFAKTDTGPMDYVIPFVGLLVTKARATMSAAWSKGRLAVSLTAPTVPTGKVTVKAGRKVVGSGTLTSGDRGSITVRLTKLKPGKHKLTVAYAGSATVEAASLKQTVTVR